MKFRLIIQGIIIGLITGGVIVLNRLGINKLYSVFIKFYAWGNKGIVNAILVIIALALIGLLVGLMVKREGMISGSGIPQVKGRVINKLKMNWLRILIYKFLGGLIALSAGLSLGREGPSVQIGSSIGEGVAEKTYKKMPVKKEFLITAGASAGLSAAFNSPLSGIIFALEEIHRNFSPLVLLPAMAAAISADFISKNFLGMEPALNFSEMNAIPLKYYWILIILGVFTGILGVLFSKGIYLFQDIYSKLKKVPQEVKVMIPFVITAIVGLIAPMLLGGGHELILELTEGGQSILFLIIIYILKFLLLLVCFGSGVPGGIFLPMLLLGAIIGDVFGVLSIELLGVNSSFIINFIALGMAGYFVSVVKAPVTGIVLIMEMTGSFSHLLSLSVVVIISFITSELLRNEPIYEVLLERLLKRVGVSKEENDNKKAILEFVVEMESIVEGKFISEVDWPKDCLLVSIKRGDKEIIPRGSVKLISGDYIVVLVNIDKRASVIEEINGLTLV
ncbi:chloride channel protein [Clostridium tertium]|uniref:ClC family H(+)/Cl(-) exchange transporter n=2 Tax=Clostridium TaxID=1485 RepID=UPI0006880C3F|nr:MULTISPECIES: ClC family H(+)/Cl(-) exchange transporter [Clostridium]MDU8966287.1 chloride channel protein [Clostridium sp.]MBU6136525.1 ClC family H(+)/Cl(-) exchange transporter [Clostridium tertium]MDB1954661.1 chloride channel protein [Clostridium tertium]MDB1959689.1 chloride channel protein [Clostridium tertium]MDB1963525.1 chloride channel protein [Clostridium tertium]